MLLTWLLGVAVVAWRGRSSARDRWAGQQTRSAANEIVQGAPVRLDDPRLTSIRQANESWRHAIQSHRLVIDQVCLVPDVDSFFEAIAAWDERHFFPILIDEPRWVLPFLRTFRPARVVRYGTRARNDHAPSPPVRPEPRPDRLLDWQSALAAVAQAGAGPEPAGSGPPSRYASLPPIRPVPGVVLAAPGSSMLAGAVALAAGHSQPLVLLEPDTRAPRKDGPGGVLHFGDLLTPLEAWNFARRVELRVASQVPHYGQLGDDCDFLTLAGDWPYRYARQIEIGPARGVYALDDLIGRRLELRPAESGAAASMPRWAYAGRLLGDAPASVARAMAALFLQPSSALLWNTYTGGDPRPAYTMKPAAELFARAMPGAGAVVHRAGRQADLIAWHRTLGPVSRFGLLLINSSGGPDYFTIADGPGGPSDLPRGGPSVVAMVHSFSAADPTDPETIAGRWLAQGAFIYFGSVNEPYLPAFRTPRLLAAMLAAGVPLVAALRQSEHEAFGFPWRLVYLGDPLYRLEAATSVHRSRAAARIESSGSDSPQADRSLFNWLRAWPTPETAMPEVPRDRLSPADWQAIAGAYAHWPAVEIARQASTTIPTERREFPTENERLHWCLDAAIGESIRPTTAPARSIPGAPTPAVDWTSILRQVHRDRLDRRLRPVFDDLLIDALVERGAIDELQSRLMRVPSEDCGPRVWLSLETGAMDRLARLAGMRNPVASFTAALNLWAALMRFSWPAGSPFPAQFTARIGALADLDAYRRRGPWLDRLSRVSGALASQPGRVPQAAVVAAEKARVEALLRRH
jgi:hypothetical protein